MQQEHSREYEDLDGRMDYAAFYGKYLRGMKKTGRDKMTAPCPFHDDRHPSFWFNLRSGCWVCEAGCGKGNAVTFLSRLEGISTGEAFDRLKAFASDGDKVGRRRVEVTKTSSVSPPGCHLPQRGRLNMSSDAEGGFPAQAAAVSMDKSFPIHTDQASQEVDMDQPSAPLPLTVAEYAEQKKLPEEFLRSLGLRDHAAAEGRPACVAIPYYDENGTQAFVKYRCHPRNTPRFFCEPGAKLLPYGLWLPVNRDAGRKGIILAEGESDTQSCVCREIPCLGIPG
ncbi:MAG: hypothetical protein K5922_04085, partial [Clostridiales bacterium]|nr:hypothetical protein [Clostridiales bacterium]